ncbi:MAG: 3-deoxy-7-phosphoheptulonate synthase [Acidobacteria bacterium]|nr:3-deoxy-7-phosphoheptulonate synthase [Acidobacteriota bacterium]MBK7599526.1 3-deoxy-7-phosphoheptulonate synthase [Acidobacteriota bacterium]
MLVVMKSGATDQEIGRVIEAIEAAGLKAHSMPGANRTAIGITGNTGAIDSSPFSDLPGVAECVRVTKPYKLVGRELKPERTVIRIGDAEIGGDEFAIIAGVCAVESREQTFLTAAVVSEMGCKFFRGGAFKPRTSPYAFQGLGEEGLKILSDVRDQYDLKIVTEATDEPALDLVERYADVIQIGTRNMQNFSLLKRAGQARKPVLLKRGMAATIEEFLLAAEYIMSEGNYQVILCERGVRTFANHTRFTLDLSLVPAIKRISHLPIIIDPSHSTGKREKVIPLSRAGAAVGADGLLVDIHPYPERALCDGPQALLFDQFKDMVAQVRSIAAIVSGEEKKITKQTK